MITRMQLDALSVIFKISGHISLVKKNKKNNNNNHHHPFVTRRNAGTLYIFHNSYYSVLLPICLLYGA